MARRRRTGQTRSRGSAARSYRRAPARRSSVRRVRAQRTQTVRVVVQHQSLAPVSTAGAFTPPVGATLVQAPAPRKARF